MNAQRLIGLIGAAILKRDSVSEQTESVARFLLDRLTGQQVAEICSQILLDPDLTANIEVKIPKTLISGYVIEYGLPDEFLTEERTVYWRNAPCSKPAIVLANTNDDQGQSLRDVTSIGTREIKSEFELWVDIASDGLGLPPAQIKHWKQAIKGLQSANDYSLDQFARYVFKTKQKILEESVPVIDALGWALPELRLPRDSGYFRSIPDNALGQAQKWQSMFHQAISKRGCLLLKETPTRKLIESEDLRDAFDRVRFQIPDLAHAKIEKFISGAPGWNVEAEELSRFEWEQDNINTVFSGLQVKKVDLASATLDFYDFAYPDTLLEEEKKYLQTLRKRSTKEVLEEDMEFYDNHRQELSENRSLKIRWDKFVYGQPIECTDFLIGLVTAIERLFERIDNFVGTKRIVIKTHLDKSKAKWLNINADVATYFCNRYRGIDLITSSAIDWDTHWLFKYNELLEESEKKRNYKRNASLSKAAIEIKFYVELHLQSKSDEQIEKTQLIWKFDPNNIGLELYDDLKRLLKSAFTISNVSCELVSKKGKLQNVSLKDVGTLMAAYGQDRGSLIGAYKRQHDLEKTLSERIIKIAKEGRISSENLAPIEKAWNNFKKSYTQALDSFLNREGLASNELINQCNSYKELLETLLVYVRGDRNRLDILDPILQIGCVQVDQRKPAAIVAPWHPMRLAAMAIKVKQIAGLIKYVVNAPNVDFGDSKLFFSELRAELLHPYYPEICVGYSGQQPWLLHCTDTVNDYSLMERPIRDFSDLSTNEDPSNAASSLLALTQRYLELLPHEKTNLSVVLYNCDSTRLPEAVVNKLSVMDEEKGEVRCQVNLRHQDTKKLNKLYQGMIESSDSDPDTFVASEISRDFMAKLRIGVMVDSTPAPNPKDGKPADIIFLQDVISRQAKEVWQPSLLKDNAPNLFEHVPARWSRKRPTGKDELKSTVYLTCPSQPEVGWTYIKAIYCLLKAEDHNEGQVFLPARQVMFQDESTKTIFDEVHKLAEWVVNYDELLEKRQLSNLGVKVIRYQQNRTDERNLIVSSKTSLDLLKVLVKRRLDTLDLGLNDSDIISLADRFIEEANSLSGDIVLRAAKRGKFASELMGLVLSKALVISELGKKWPIGWYFLDDYASWLGQKEEQIADILAISPQIISGSPVLKIIVSEAKYVAAEGVSESRKNSQKQLRDTISRIVSAIFGNPGRLDRDFWLSRIGDLLLEGLELTNDFPLSIEKLRDEIRKGAIPIDLSGYSHVFVHSYSDSTRSGDQIPVPKIEKCFQEMFSRDQVKQLVLAYHKKQDLSKIREQLGSEKPWLLSSASLPASRVSWVEDILEISKQQVIIVNEPIVELTSENPQSISYLLEKPETIEEIEEKNEETQETVEQSSSTQPVSDNKQTVCDYGALSTWIEQKKCILSEDSNLVQWLDSTAQSLRTALISYDLQAKILGQRLTPNAAIIRFMGSDRLRIEDVEKKRSQLLTTHSLNVINVLGQPGEIVVFVARPQRQSISLVDMWASRKINRSSSGLNLSLVVGYKEIDGELLYINLAGEFAGLQQHAPHTLIAGATGSGKSVLLRNMLLDICATNHKDLAKIYLIDPKAGVDYFFIEDMPHLSEGIIITQDHATKVLDSLAEEMDSRYLRFREQKVSNLLAYNNKVDKEKRLPAIWLVHDEFAEWMLVESYKETVSATVQRLGVKARAAGIYLIFAAQRPDATVLPVQLRDNLGNRLILKVESVGTSEIALGQKGAEHLLGKGHLAARLSGEQDIILAQVPFLSDEDMENVAQIIKEAQ